MTLDSIRNSCNVLDTNIFRYSFVSFFDIFTYLNIHLYQHLYSSHPGLGHARPPSVPTYINMFCNNINNVNNVNNVNNINNVNSVNNVNNINNVNNVNNVKIAKNYKSVKSCLLYTSDAADE